jgi:tRNA 2-selenouridine synthase
VLAARNIAGTLWSHVAWASRATGARWSTAGAAASARAALAWCWAQIGFRVVQLEGGYKAFRARGAPAAGQPAGALHWQRAVRPHRQRQDPAAAGAAAAGAPGAGPGGLAAHRGSILGDMPGRPQPSQKRFDTLIWHALRGFDPSRPVFVESESARIGRLRVPATGAPWSAA